MLSQRQLTKTRGKVAISAFTVKPNQNKTKKHENPFSNLCGYRGNLEKVM